MEEKGRILRPLCFQKWSNGGQLGRDIYRDPCEMVACVMEYKEGTFLSAI